MLLFTRIIFNNVLVFLLCYWNEQKRVHTPNCFWLNLCLHLNPFSFICLFWHWEIDKFTFIGLNRNQTFVTMLKFRFKPDYRFVLNLREVSENLFRQGRLFLVSSSTTTTTLSTICLGKVVCSWFPAVQRQLHCQLFV